jgi:hypothetical protein
MDLLMDDLANRPWITFPSLMSARAKVLKNDYLSDVDILIQTKVYVG